MVVGWSRWWWHRLARADTLEDITAAIVHHPTSANNHPTPKIDPLTTIPVIETENGRNDTTLLSGKKRRLTSRKARQQHSSSTMQSGRHRYTHHVVRHHHGVSSRSGVVRRSSDRKECVSAYLTHHCAEGSQIIPQNALLNDPLKRHVSNTLESSRSDG